ncbi:MmcQ/YjbR family DNA-binding protein [Saccharopolyspora sp. K220]|uniref:MmcQ/YjbR family DNA-binding protein n=1 Tax=Saccharopolyspora soli TaxID=2926618 RepID=UPI001F5A9CD9|nr:MmcQ/YjbR family DNA-binding protein [Saccharopolyspora soli]MCI2419996.1 MmcQ/YjbR family DNA-binding protein [Saccharopolyspora soli]
MATSWDDDERDRVRARLVELITTFPGVRIEDSHGHTGFLLRDKRFAWLLVDHHGDGRLALWVKAPPGEQEGLVADDARYFVPAYLGPKGWVGANLDAASNPDWSEIAALLEQAWRMSATKRAIAEYDRGRES